MNYQVMPGLINSFTLPQNASYRQDVVVEAVCKYFKITKYSLYRRNRSRRAAVLRPRQIAQFLLMSDCSMGVKAAGLAFKQDHTTAIHSRRVITNMLDTNYEPVVQAIRAIRSQYM